MSRTTNPINLLPPDELAQTNEVLIPALRWAESKRYKATPRTKALSRRSPEAQGIGLDSQGRFYMVNAHLRERPARMLVIIPAHNEAETITDTLEQIVTQSRRPDKVVVVADNCTDDTEKVVLAFARKHPVVELMTTIDNKERKVGALNRAWLLYSRGFDVIACVDADTVLWNDVLAELEAELVPRTRCAGVMAKYTFDQDWVPPDVVSNTKEPSRSSGKEIKPVAAARLPWKTRQLVRAQRMEFTSHTLDLLRRKRQTYVLGGQATLFRQNALVHAAYLNNGYGPWSSDTEVEDMELTWRFQDLKFETLVSSTARADAGAMYTPKALWAQRRKWDEGTIRLLLRYKIRRQTLYPWMQQMKMGLDLVVRLLFILLLTVSISLQSFRWSWVWLIPPLLAILINLKVATKAPRRRAADFIFALLYFPAEIYLWFRLASFVASWGAALTGPGRDNWARQRQAEGGASTGSAAGVLLLGSLCMLVVAMVIGTSVAPRWLADNIVNVGWFLMKTLTITLTITMAFKLISMILRDRRHEA